jgi:hypothetical protein
MHSPFRLSPLLFAPAIFAFACTVEPNPNSTSSTASSSSSSSTSGEAGSGGLAGAGGMSGGSGGMSGGAGGMATGGAAGSGGAMAMAPKPDFGLVDVNPNSVTSGKTISPRDYTGQISAWYFGHAT